MSALNEVEDTKKKKRKVSSATSNMASAEAAPQSKAIPQKNLQRKLLQGRPVRCRSLFSSHHKRQLSKARQRRQVQENGRVSPLLRLYKSPRWVQHVQASQGLHTFVLGKARILSRFEVPWGVTPHIRVEILQTQMAWTG